MAKQAFLFLPAGANNQSVTITSADTTVAKLCFTAGSEGSDVSAIIVTSSDTAAINLQLYVTRSAVDYLLGTINIPIGSGSNGTAASIDILNTTSIPGLALDNVGKRYLKLKSGDTLKVGPIVTMTAAKTCWVSLFGEDY